ncbi:hypothetical protein [Corynebacterium lactis]|uniref:Galactokinase n=1 Tax=Corynebacterium lactis RW2-5 TaxID=1408189 RepID=A0A0K2H3H3_9CORY|nr:hypothetical protein [Corynebacterium lactis]ALA68587.1 hypothetical protein CLAC_08260 [Corynebacterium lactis RW2-5]
MPAAPAVVNDVFDATGPGATVAYAPGSIDLLGEDCSSSGGMLLASAIPVHAAVGVEEIEEQKLIVTYKRDTTTMDFPDSAPEGFGPIPSAVATAIVALQHGVHLVPRTSGGLKVTIASTIASSRGFGEIPAIQSALALALNARFGDRDDVPTRARMATAIHEAMTQVKDDSWPLYPYTVSLRSKPDAILCINHADEAVTQTTRPQSLNLTVAYSPDITGGSPTVERYSFFREACDAFGVPTLASLPEAQGRVADWVRARHEVHPDEEAPTIGRAVQWLDDADASSDRARAVIGHIRHSDIDAAIAGVARDIEQRDSVPSAGSALGQIASTAAETAEASAIRCSPCPGAALVIWSPSDSAEPLQHALSDAGAQVLRIAETSAGAVVV